MISQRKHMWIWDAGTLDVIITKSGCICTYWSGSVGVEFPNGRTRGLNWTHTKLSRRRRSGDGFELWGGVSPPRIIRTLKVLMPQIFSTERRAPHTDTNVHFARSHLSSMTLCCGVYLVCHAQQAMLWIWKMTVLWISCHLPECFMAYTQCATPDKQCYEFGKWRCFEFHVVYQYV